MSQILQALTTFCSAVFFGAAVYISLVQHPAANETGQEFTTRFFRPMYRRGAVMQASLAVVGTLSGILAYVSGSGAIWLLAALLLGSVVPITLLVIRPVNDQLMSQTLDSSSSLAGELLARWGRLHGLRVFGSGLSFFVCLIAAYV